LPDGNRRRVRRRLGTIVAVAVLRGSSAGAERSKKQGKSPQAKPHPHVVHPLSGTSRVPHIVFDKVCNGSGRLPSG